MSNETDFKALMGAIAKWQKKTGASDEWALTLLADAISEISDRVQGSDTKEQAG